MPFDGDETNQSRLAPTISERTPRNRRERERKTDADATGKAFELFPSLIRRSFLPPAPRSVRPSLRPSDREGRRSLCGCSPCSVSSVRPSRSSAISHQLLESANPSRIEASFRALLAAQAQLEVECELTTCNPESIHWFNKRIEKLLRCSFCDHHSPDPVNSSICAFKLGIPSRNYDLRTAGCVNNGLRFDYPWMGLTGTRKYSQFQKRLTRFLSIALECYDSLSFWLADQKFL